MNAISLSVSLSVSDPKDLVLFHSAMQHLMIELNSVHGQPALINVDPVSGYISKPEIDVVAPEPKVKRVRSPKQLAHDAILRQNSIARHLSLGHNVVAKPEAQSVSKKSKGQPATEQGLLKRPVHIAQPIHPAPKPIKKQVVVIATDPDMIVDMPDPFEHPVLVETHYADGSVKVTKDQPKAKKPIKSSKRVVEVEVKGKPIQVSKLSKKGHKVGAASAAE